LLRICISIYCIYGNNSQCSSAAKITKYIGLPHENLDALKTAVAIQPVSVAVESNAKRFRFYSREVYDDSDCGVFVDYAVPAVEVFSISIFPLH
jgi:hypothetical protein